MALLTIFLFIGLIGILCYHKANLLFSSLLILAYCLIMASVDLWYFWTLLLGSGGIISISLSPSTSLIHF